MTLTIITQNSNLVVDSRLIALELNIQHETIIETIRKYKTELETFGVFRFETGEVQNGRPPIFVYLNEDQATFLLTLSRNTEAVVKCKRNLVESFSKAKKLLYSVSNSNKYNLQLTYYILDEAFKNLPINPNIVAQQKINAAIKLDPTLQPLLSESLKLLVDSTAQQKQLLNPTQIGKLLNPPKSAKSVNLLLLDKGLQYKNTSKSSSKESDYLPTELAKGYYELTLDGSNGTTYQQLRWYESVIELLS